MTVAVAIRVYVVVVLVAVLWSMGVGLIALAAGTFSPAYWAILIVGNLPAGLVIAPRVIRALRPEPEDEPR